MTIWAPLQVGTTVTAIAATITMMTDIKRWREGEGEMRTIWADQMCCVADETVDDWNASDMDSDTPVEISEDAFRP